MLTTTTNDYSWKKLVGKEFTTASKNWFEEKDGILNFPHSSQVWLDTIPSTPTNTTSIRKINGMVLTENTTVSGKKSWYVVDEFGNRLKGFIPPTYGLDYTAFIYVDGIRLATTHQSSWFFDYANGILNFENTPPTGTITLDAYLYVGKTVFDYISTELTATFKGVFGESAIADNYIIQHNLGTEDIDVILYVRENIDGVDYWKREVIPLLILDENNVKIQFSESKVVKIIVKAYI